MLIPLPNLGAIEAQGDDRLTYLQSQLTCDLVKLPQNRWTFGGHCDPKGKLLAAFRLCHHGDSLLMLMPQSLVEVDLPALAKYAVFNKIELTDATARYDAYGLLDTAVLDGWQGEDNLKQQGEALALIDGEHAIVLLPAGAELPADLAALPQGEAEQFIAAELAAGRPWFEAEHSAEFVPQMLNLDAVGGVQYDKGCYIGQETVARMHFRGGNKRALYVLTGQPSDADTLEMQVGDNWRRAGVVVARQANGDQQWLTAVLSKELAPDTRFRLGEAEYQLAPLPYRLYGEA
ncbi:CAF17-like 4Fe-4S cluster assembly/insertion protein YgfZ [Ferrimonas marina]|uniref:tRNA-modifying protein YgfZ-like beta-barrel domain-containing protein n=1 Tax=Ferrimonas marina TaxID=299255 RepID=A0A1M5VPA4_9GAMM|nr:hypothetical protein [Ferrimonas marina]SHH77057.1 hypothetical protein SAMN02745129_2894 [Ferrimonas marina]